MYASYLLLHVNILLTKKYFIAVFGLPTDIVAASLNSIGVQEIAGLEAKVSTPDCLLTLMLTWFPDS